MKNNKRKTNKILSVMLVLTIVFSMFSGLGITVGAATPPSDSYYTKIADPATLDGWRQFFGTTALSTENAGGVWTDKSVFVNGSSFTGLTDAYGDAIIPTVSEDSFLVVLSAIASNKSIVGYSHIPTDTVLVLDISGSMGPGSGNNNAVADLVLAANAAITELLELNNNNRIGVVLYSAEYEDGNDEHYYTLLPIERYAVTGTVTYNNGTRFDTSDDITVGKFLETNSTNSYNGNEISIASGVTNSNGNVRRQTIDIVGGTFIQGGLKTAADLFKGKSDANDTVIKGDGFQSGTQRKPVVVLMSDGAPTYATTNFTDAANPNRGTGHNTYESYGFLTQLTAAYVKEKITEYYNGSEALFYTLGLGVGGSAIAQSVLDPANSTLTINDYWNDYKNATNNATVEIENNISVTKTDLIDDIVYVDQYFEADSRGDLFTAFEKIVDQIIIQSLYRPTLVENNNAHMEGYIEFIDDIGDFMAVKQIEGIMIGDKLFTGEKLCENFRADGGDLGTIQNPNTLGDNLIWAVKERLGIEDTATAQRLVTLAYEHGQLSYTDEDNYSNYIGWYADENGKYLGFWDESHTYSQAPVGAKYINKSYGMLGEVVDGHNTSDLMYVSIQVHTEMVPQGMFGTTEKDTIDAGHAQMIFRVPASLIPVVNYEVTLEGTDYDNAKNIEMTINDAEPIRLLFEVGLRDDINEYNIERRLADNYRTADGKYVLYTNEWSQEQFNKEIDPSNTDYIAPTDSINTIAYFEPNYANERYYYTEPTPVYVYNSATGEYVKYSSTTKPTAGDGNVYFRQINVFELTGNGNEAVHKKVYERISDTALGRVDKSDTNVGWNIRKETIHRVYDEIETLKANNETGTINYSYFPTVEHIEGTHYYADAILGNNGKLTVTPVTGISLTKTIDDTLTGTTHDFTFNVDIGDTTATYSIVRSFDGNYTDKGETITVDSDGKGTINVKPGETVLIVGIPAGTAYSIEEYIPSGANYEVSTSSGTTGTIQQNHLSEVKFENTLADGNLVITKRIVHPFATAPDSMNNHVFKFDVMLSGYNDGDTVKAYYSTDVDNKFDLTINGGTISNLELRGNQSIVILAKAGAKAVVTEDITAMPKGFSLGSVEPPANNIIATDNNVVYVFTNTYNPAAVNPDITINASKEFTGRPWNNDSFTFALYRYEPANARYVEIGRETINAAGNFGTTLTSLIKAESFTQVGTYHYSIREIAPANTMGITYDIATRDFDIVVTDEDTDGTLEIAAVTNANLTTVAASGTAYTVTADRFVNSYKADGIAEVVIQIDKTVDTPSGITYSPEGFEFGFYDAVTGELVSPLYTTDADGKVQFVFAYNADGVDYQNDKVINYVIKETNTGLGGITYAQDIPVTVTVKDNLDGTISATTSIAKVENNVSVVDVTNVYSTTDVDVTIEANKKITGRYLVNGEFNFAIKDVDNNVVVQDDATNDADGKVVFDKLTFDTVGTYNYVVYENEVDGNGVTVDKTQHNVVINVTDNGEGNLVAEVTVNGTTVGGTTANAITFTNTYEPDAVQVTLEATKKLTGRDTPLANNEFKFALVQGNGTVVQDDATNNANGKVVFNALTFDTAGSYDYTIYENEVDGNGITVDTRHYIVTIFVHDNGQGNLLSDVYVDANKVTGSTANTIVFENRYSANPVEVNLEATKTLTGRDTPLGNNEFKFALAKKDGTVVQGNATNSADGKVVFNKLTFDTVGTYEYVVYENEVDANGITVDKTQHDVTIVITDNNKGNLVATVNGTAANTAVNVGTFANIYKAANTQVILEATKTLDGRDLRDGEFKFDLYDVNENRVLQNDVALVLKPDGTGNITFNAITFDKVGTYKYKVYEDELNENGITADTTEYNVTIVVTDNNKGQLIAAVQVDGADVSGSTAGTIVFRNSYKAASVDVVIEAVKTLTGRTLLDGEFKFALKDADSDTLVQEDATNDADGKVVFNKLTFDTAGTYNYVVYENEVDGKGVTVDAVQYNVTIVVTDNGLGQLVATVGVNNVTVSGSTADVIKFNNNYNTAGEINITANKVLTGRDLEAEEFEFALYDEQGNLIEAVKNTADGKIIFTTIGINQAGEYIYTVKEIKGNVEHVTYDETVYTVKVTATDNGDGTLKVEYAYENEAGTAEEIVFTNTYTEPVPEPTPEPTPDPEPSSPVTGDSANPFLWLALAFVSGVTVITGKKLKRVNK